MNITKTIALCAGLALGTSTLPAQGFGPGMGGRGSCGFRPGRCETGLALTEAQQAGYRKILDAHRPALDAKLKAAAEAREAQRKAMHDPSVSDARVKELHAGLSEAQAAVLLERRAMMREFEALLTPEQKATLDSKRLQGGPGRKGRRGCGGCS